MTTKDDAARLLLALNTATGGDTHDIWNAAEDPGWAEAGDERIALLIDYLVSNGFADNFRTLASGTGCRITAAGVVEAERYTRERDNPVRRLDFAADALVAAAVHEYPSYRLQLDCFVGSSRTWFYDHVLEIDEVQRAVDHLEQHGLVEAERGPGRVEAVRLTPLGVECASQNPISVRRFMNEQQPAAQLITINGPAQIGNHNTQNNTFGLTPDQMTRFADELLAAARSADITDTARGRLVGEVEVLQAELRAAEPEPGRLRRALGRVRTAAWEVLPGVIVQGVFGAFGIPLG